MESSRGGQETGVDGVVDAAEAAVEEDVDDDVVVVDWREEEEDEIDMAAVG